jgi:hypothetical protein
MARYAQVISVERTTEEGSHVVNVKVDPGSGNTVTAEYVAPPGDDSLPLPGDFVALVPIEGEGREQAVGYTDPKNLGKSANGEIRRYARKSDGTPTAHIWMKNDGSILIECLSSDVPITIHSTGTLSLLSDADDIRLGQGGSQIATVDSIVVSSLDVATIATAMAAPHPSGSISIAGSVVTGLPNASGG